MGALLELADPGPEVAVQEVEYRRLLGVPRDHELSERATELASEARAWYAEHGRPWLYARQAASLALGEGAVRIETAAFRSRRLHDTLAEAGAGSAVLVAVSAGRALEERAHRLWEEGKPDEYYFLETYGSAVVEALVAAAAYRLCEWADGHAMAVLPHYSPGYPDWDIADQRALHDLIGLERAQLPGRLSVLESGMLRPKKSLLAVFGLTREVERTARLTSLVPCHNCSLPACGYRRAPYRHPLPRLEAVGMGVAAAAMSRQPGAGPSVPGGPARYSVSERVLERWSRQRLEMHVREDRTIEAVFRYDGTTCSNLGQPLAFEYHVRLAPREAGYAIVDLSCAPAPGDVGHTYMCAYLEDPGALMRGIAAERPLLGRPLDDVLTWRRGDGPAGCYCAAEDREHKWGLALEVLHYALTRQGEPAVG
jgi:hypothetical protein